MLVGAIVVSTFAVIWIAAGTRNLDRRWFSWLLSISILISLGVIVAAGKIAPAHPATFNGKAYGLSVAFEAVLIFLAVLFLRPQTIPPPHYLDHRRLAFLRIGLGARIE